MALLYRYGWWDVDEITKIKSVDITLSTYEIVWIDDDTRTLFRFCVAYEWARVKNPKLFTENAHVQTRVIPTITATVVMWKRSLLRYHAVVHAQPFWAVRNFQFRLRRYWRRYFFRQIYRANRTPTFAPFRTRRVIRQKLYAPIGAPSDYYYYVERRVKYRLF